MCIILKKLQWLNRQGAISYVWQCMCNFYIPKICEFVNCIFNSTLRFNTVHLYHSMTRKLCIYIYINIYRLYKCVCLCVFSILKLNQSNQRSAKSIVRTALIQKGRIGALGKTFTCDRG